MKANIFIKLLSIIFVWYSCGPKVLIRDAVIDNENALKVSLQFSTTHPAEAQIEYWSADDTSSFFSKKTRLDTFHVINLLPLKANNSYEYTIHLESDNKVVKSPILYFKTIALPEDLPEFELISSREAKFEGYVMVRKVQDPGAQILLDRQGDIIWYNQIDTTVMRPFSFDKKGEIVGLINPQKYVEIDLAGKVANENENSKFNLHHEILKDPEGNVLSLMRQLKIMDLSILGGNKQDTIHGDGIVKISPTGDAGSGR